LIHLFSGGVCEHFSIFQAAHSILFAALIYGLCSLGAGIYLLTATPPICFGPHFIFLFLIGFPLLLSYCFYDKSKIWVEDVLWACGDCEPFDPDEHLPEKEPPTCDQATEGDQGLAQKLKQRENRPDKQNDGNKAGNSTNSSPVDSPMDRTEPGQSSAIQKKKGKEKVKKTQNQAG